MSTVQTPENATELTCVHAGRRMLERGFHFFGKLVVGEAFEERCGHTARGGAVDLSKQARSSVVDRDIYKSDTYHCVLGYFEGSVDHLLGEPPGDGRHPFKPGPREPVRNILDCEE